MNQDNLWNIPSSIARNERTDNRRFAVGPNRSVDGREFVSNGVQTRRQCMQMRKPQCLHKWIVQAAIRRLTNFYSDTSFFGNSRVTIVVKDDRYWSVINQFHRLEKPISKSRKVISSQTKSAFVTTNENFFYLEGKTIKDSSCQWYLAHSHPDWSKW